MGKGHSNLSQTIGTENIHANSTTWIEQVIFRNIYAHTNAYMHAIKIIEEKGP